MINKHNDPIDNRDANPGKRFSDQKTDQKIHRHLSDINDQITEQDIKDVRTDIDKEIQGTDEIQTPPPISKKNESDDDDKPAQKEEPKTDKKDNPTISPWNMLNS